MCMKYSVVIKYTFRSDIDVKKHKYCIVFETKTVTLEVENMQVQNVEV